MKDGLDGVTVGTFTLESITVGKTKKGKDISSATVLWSDAPAFTKTAKKQKAPTPATGGHAQPHHPALAGRALIVSAAMSAVEG